MYIYAYNTYVYICVCIYVYVYTHMSALMDHAFVSYVMLCSYNLYRYLHAHLLGTAKPLVPPVRLAGGSLTGHLRSEELLESTCFSRKVRGALERTIWLLLRIGYPVGSCPWTESPPFWGRYQGRSPKVGT